MVSATERSAPLDLYVSVATASTPAWDVSFAEGGACSSDRQAAPGEFPSILIAHAKSCVVRGFPCSRSGWQRSVLFSFPKPTCLRTSNLVLASAPPPNRPGGSHRPTLAFVIASASRFYRARGAVASHVPRREPRRSGRRRPLEARGGFSSPSPAQSPRFH